MRYKMCDLIQSTKFSCLDELKCDVIEYLLSDVSQSYDYSVATIILPSDLARILYTKFLQADVNGFHFKLFEEYTNVEVTTMLAENDYVLLELDKDGKIFFDRGKVYDCTGSEKSEMVYLHESLQTEWLSSLIKNSAYVLVWNIEK